MTFKDFLKKLDENLEVIAISVPLLMFTTSIAIDKYYSYQRNKDPIGYDQRIIKERIGQLEKRNSQISEGLSRKASPLELFFLPGKIVCYTPKVAADIIVFGHPIGLTEEKYMNECKIERLNEAYSDLEKQKGS